MGDYEIVLSVTSDLASRVRERGPGYICERVDFIINDNGEAINAMYASKSRDFYESMLNRIVRNLPWIQQRFEDDFIKDETTYAAPKIKIRTKLAYMLGIKADYILRQTQGEPEEADEDSDSLDQLVDTMLDYSEESDVENEEISYTPQNRAASRQDDSKENILRVVEMKTSNKGIEDSSSSTSSSPPPSPPSVPFVADNDNSRGGNEVLVDDGDDDKKSKDKVTDDSDVGRSVKAKKRKTKSSSSYFKEFKGIPNFDKSICYDYFRPRGKRRIVVGIIERDMIKEQCVRPLKNTDSTLLRALQQSNMIEYVRLVNTFARGAGSKAVLDVFSVACWKSWIINGCSLCFYGAGSKIETLKAFRNVALRDGHSFTINASRAIGTGYDALWHTLKVNLFGNKIKMSRSKAVESVVEKIGQMRRPFYMVIYGIDTFLINGGFNEVAPLLALPNVAVVGSMDHLRCSMLLQPLDAYLGNCRFIAINTAQEYTRELIAHWDRRPPRFIIEEQAEINAGELSAVLTALSQNHRKLFALIAKIQLEAMKPNVKFNGIDKSRILRDPRAATICNNESKLDALLTEFTTHNLVEQYRGIAGRMHLKIPFKRADLEQFTRKF